MQTAISWWMQTAYLTAHTMVKHKSSNLDLQCLKRTSNQSSSLQTQATLIWSQVAQSTHCHKQHLKTSTTTQQVAMQNMSLTARPTTFQHITTFSTLKTISELESGAIIERAQQLQSHTQQMAYNIQKWHLSVIGILVDLQSTPLVATDMQSQP